MFYDEVTVILRAGSGGDGCMSFRREKYIPKGGPNGGDGGKGGDVILLCDCNANDLTPYHFTPHASADHGEPGRGSDQNGAQGKPCYLKMPPGTIVQDINTGQAVAELLVHGQEVVLLRGGRGGKGNINFKSSTNQAPRRTTPGEAGQEGRFRLVLKSIADVGLVGFPNAGKSSLTRLITRAEPKTAPYPFTTLHPHIGIILYGEDYVEERLVLADIPGLIRGASENRGLGHRFLRHIERCHVLLIILDMAGEDARNPLEDYEVLLEELRLYDPALLNKPRILAANKMDEEAAAEHLKAFRKKYPELSIIPISCLAESGLAELKDALLRTVRQVRTLKVEEEKAEE